MAQRTGATHPCTIGVSFSIFDTRKRNISTPVSRGNRERATPGQVLAEIRAGEGKVKVRPADAPGSGDVRKVSRTSQ